ncbi:cytidylate kinase [Ignicoccus pacificus DSM 13166]|uniref:Cytidylate kinase n=1 Tax=Ignicoccus pacificus DSM 13166 TaxID=940294 RepID=A0A977KA64_9CREN|nr:cytidylate kinase [Ignicoccus pacificus DSM 13166]
MPTIVISGPPGSGKSTVAKMLSELLNLPVISAGSIFRSIAREMGMDLVKFNEYAKENPRIDIEIDLRTLKASIEGNVIIEGHLTAWVAPKADLKVYLTAPIRVRAKRIAKRDGIDEEEAMFSILEREKAHWERFKALYGIDITDLSPFDLVVDTSKFRPEEISNMIISYIKRSYS